MVLVGLNFKPLAEGLHTLAGLEPDQVRNLFAAEGLIRNFETGTLSESEFYEEVCRRIGIRISWPDFLRTWCSVFERPLLPDELLAALARKTHLWALSNTNKLHFDYMLRTFTFLSHFEGFILSHQVGALKPDSRIFLQALQKTQAHPSEVLFVDDQEANVNAARELGIEAFQFHAPDQFASELKTRRLL
jgi:putative hydrolase of the HAD superfamily